MRPQLATAALLALAAPALATVAFTQPPNPNGGMIKSAWYAPDGMDGDAWAWDSFQLSTTQTFNEISWRGGYAHYLSGAGKSPVYDFTIEIYASIAAGIQPDVVNPPLVSYQVGTNASETLAGVFGGTPMYDYHYTLPVPFEASANTKYWVQIEAFQGLTPQYYWPPDWSIAYAAPGSGNGSHFYAMKGSTIVTRGVIYQNRSNDLAFTLASVTPVVNAVWNHNGNGDWTEAGNWNNGVAPNGPDHSATFGTAITAPRTVTVNAPVTVGTINFMSDITYQIAGTSAVTLDAPGSAGIIVTAGSHAIAAPVALAADATFNVEPFFSTLNITGTLTAADRTITTTGQGTVQFENIRAASLQVTSGTTIISTKAVPNSPAGTSIIDALSIAPGGWLDLGNNSMVIRYAAVGTLTDEIRQQLFDYRLYSGPADANHQLGYADNAALGLTSFAGQTVAPECILIKFTYAGDANLDGKVDVGDLGALASNWQQPSFWTGGDFNYDGTVNVGDLGILATNWQQGVTTPALGPSFAEAIAALGLVPIGIPEPAMTPALAAVALLGRRSERRRHGR